MTGIRNSVVAFLKLALAYIKAVGEFADQTTFDALAFAKPTAAYYEQRICDRVPIMQEVQLIGGALIMIFLIVFVLNEIYNSIDLETDADGNYTGPFGPVVDTLESTGATALVILVLALIVVAASAVMRFFGGGGFASR